VTAPGPAIRCLPGQLLEEVTAIASADEGIAWAQQRLAAPTSRSEHSQPQLRRRFKLGRLTGNFSSYMAGWESRSAEARRLAAWSPHATRHQEARLQLHLDDGCLHDLVELPRLRWLNEWAARRDKAQRRRIQHSAHPSR
jgi:hypothetical protein